MRGLKIFAIVKETGIDDAGLHEFHREYFKYPTYKDHERVFYNALGSGTISFGFNPLGIIKLIQDSFRRMKELGVQSYNMKGTYVEIDVFRFLATFFVVSQCLAKLYT